MADYNSAPLPEGMQENTGDETFQNNPADWFRRWTKEFKAAKDELEPWQGKGAEVVKWFLDEREGFDATESRRPYFTANIQTLRAILFGKTPKCSVTRKWGDPHDDVARVAAEMLERILNEDMEQVDSDFDAVHEEALDDWLTVGFGNVRNTYCFEEEKQEGKPAKTDPVTGQVLAEEVPEGALKVNEEVPTCYEHWQDQLWSPARRFAEVRWWAFNCKMSRQQLVKRFGEEVGNKVPLNAKRDGKDAAGIDAAQADPWGRANVWEIWDKEHKRVFWMVEGHAILESKEDTLGLKGFWPFPRPLMANTTTSKLVPKPDFALVETLYKDINEASARIRLMVKAIAIRGGYNGAMPALARLVNETRVNELVEIENWPAFKEKGGVEGNIDFLPLEMIIQALAQLIQVRNEYKEELYEISGMSDIVRGQADQQATATEQSIKASFASVRLEAMQNRFARFISDNQRIRAEIMALHWEPQSLIERSNILRTDDAPLAMQAAQFIKENFYSFRIEIKPESVSLTDYAKLKQERSEVMETIGEFLQAAAPIAQQFPPSVPFLLEMLEWLVAGVKGSSEIQGVVSRMVNAAEQALKQAAMQPPRPPPPDPRVQAQMLKAQSDQAHTAAELKADLVRTQAETQATTQQEMAKAKIGVLAEDAKQRMGAMRELATALHPTGMEGG